MSVLIETNVGSVVVDLHVEEAPLASENFIKLCKLKYYNNVLFYSVEKDFIAQTGDPSGTGQGGCSVWGEISGDARRRYFKDEIRDGLKHVRKGVLGMVSAGSADTNTSKFYVTLRDRIDFLDNKYTVFGNVVEDDEGVLDAINGLHCDEKCRPYIDTRILHTHVLIDPFQDPSGFPKEVPPSPTSDRPSRERVERRITHGDKIHEHEGRTEEEIAEIRADQIARSKAKILRDLGDIPDEDFVPEENVLFVCKLNSVTTDEDLELIFSRFGDVRSCEIMRDKVTGDSLQYAFIEYATRQQCEKAYLKMNNVTIDDRRIKVDFSQSAGKKWRRGDRRRARRSGDGRRDRRRHDSNGDRESRRQRRRSRSREDHREFSRTSRRDDDDDDDNGDERRIRRSGEDRRDRRRRDSNGDREGQQQRRRRRRSRSREDRDRRRHRRRSRSRSRDRRRRRRQRREEEDRRHRRRSRSQ